MKSPQSYAQRIIIFTTFTGLFIGLILRSSPHLISRETRRLESDAEVPKILHSIVLGSPPKQYMVEFVKFTGKIAKSYGFTHMEWNDDHRIDRLIKDIDKELEGVAQTWEYIKKDLSQGRYAKMADFLRLAVLYQYGGIYFDADVITCGRLDFMVNTPGTVSFPHQLPYKREVNAAMSSSPPHHRLIELALQRIVDHGERIIVLHNLDAAGPKMMGEVVDAYFKEKGINIPPLKEKPYHDNDSIEGIIVKDESSGWDLKIADVKFGLNLSRFGIYHFEFRSWIPGQTKQAKCFDKPEMIEPFFDYFCAHPSNRGVLTREFRNYCGKSYIELAELL